MKTIDKLIMLLSLVVVLGVGFVVYKSVFSVRTEDTPELAVARQEKLEYAESLKAINFDNFNEFNEEEVAEPTIKQATETINVLLLGLDGDSESDDVQLQQARADTMMLVSINPNTKTTKVLSIPRDTYVFIPSADDYGKINSSYVYGGPNAAVQVVEELFQTPIDFYVTINMDGLADLVDAIGGIEVTPPLTFEYRGTGFEYGVTREVNGVKAMNYLRMRKDDPRGDYGRQERQQEVVQAIINKAIDMSYKDYVKLIPFALANIRTNVDVFSAYELYAGYRDSVKTIEQVTIQDGVDAMMVDGQYYAYLLPDKQLELANIFREHSGLLKIHYIDSVQIPQNNEMFDNYSPYDYESIQDDGESSSDVGSEESSSSEELIGSGDLPLPVESGSEGGSSDEGSVSIPELPVETPLPEPVPVEVTPVPEPVVEVVDPV